MSEDSLYRFRGGKFAPSYIPVFTTSRKFADAKIEILENHLKIHLAPEDIEHLRELKTEGEINAAVKTIINKHW